MAPLRRLGEPGLPGSRPAKHGALGSATVGPAVSSRLARAATAASLLATATTLALALGGPEPAAAQAGPAEGDRFRLGLASTLQSLTGVVDPAFAVVGTEPEGIHGAVVRLKWTAEWGDRAVLQIHDRILATVTSGRGDAPAGFGVSRRPGRAFDWTSAWLREEGVEVIHDLDRLALTIYTGPVDVTVGRQAISWGTSTLFPVADLWAAFSPFELDLEERPGVDGVRALAYPGGIEVDGVVVDRGEDGVSGGIRGSWSGERWEVWGGAGRFWDRTLALAGITWLGDLVRLRAEAAAGSVTRATVGVDRITTRLSVSAEMHVNGPGADGPEGYLVELAEPALARGETYFLGRLYGGAAAAWTPDEEGRLSVALSLLANLDDGSTAWTPSVSYDLGRSARVGIGGVASTGDPPRPAADGSWTLPSEFGAYGRQIFVRVSLYY